MPSESLVDYYCLPNMSLLLISGKAGSGKDTMAQYIIDNYATANTTIVRLALADKLKRLTYALLKEFGIDINSIDDLYNTSTKNKYRHYLQHIGTECCRKIFGEDFWCEQLSKDIIAQVKNGVHVIVSDVRFTNELVYLYNVLDKYNVDGLVVSISISGRGYNNIDSKHVSELMSGFECDYVVENSSDIDAFYDKIEQMLNESGLAEMYHPSENDACIQSNQEIVTLNANTVQQSTSPTVHVQPNTVQQSTVQQSTVQQSIVQQSMSDTNTTYSSYTLGRIGETDVLRMLEHVRPDFDTILVSSTGHLGDIHAIDHNHKIKYILEIKLKQAIIKEDVEKFDRDIHSAIENNPSYRIIGIFISLNSTRIPSIGSFKIANDRIFLTKDFFSEYVLSILFSVIEVSLTSNPSRSVSEPNRIEYVISPTIINLIVQLRTEYTKIKHELELYKQMKCNTEDNLKHITELMHDIVIKEQFIAFINAEFSEIIPTIDVSVTSQEDQMLREYIQSHSAASIKKKELIQKFPTLSTKLGSMKKADIIKEYAKKK